MEIVNGGLAICVGVALCPVLGLLSYPPGLCISLVGNVLLLTILVALVVMFDGIGILCAKLAGSITVVVACCVGKGCCFVYSLENIARSRARER